MIHSEVLVAVLVTALGMPVASAQRSAAPGDDHTATAQRPAGETGGQHPHRGRREYGAMALVPPGMWWKNPSIAGDLGLTAEQSRRMDDVLHAHRAQLIDMHTRLEEAQAGFEPLLKVNPPDQARVLASISQIADLRAELEKANGRMLIELRSILTAAQWDKLQEARLKHMDDVPDHFHKDGPPTPGQPR